MMLPTKELEVTIGITCFNGEKTIGKAMDSALTQNYAPKEIIVVDDGSSDQSVRIIQELMKAHPLKIKLVKHSQNLGCPASRNAILQHAKGDYIAFFDDDDISSNERLKQQVRVIQKTPRWREYSIACYASGFKLYQNGYKKRFHAPGSLGSSPNAVQLKRHLLVGEKKGTSHYGNGTPASTLMISTLGLKKIGGFDQKQKRLEDVEMIIRFVDNGGILLGVDKDVVVRMATHAVYKDAYKEHKSFLRILVLNKRFLQSINRYSFTFYWAFLRHYHFSKQSVKLWSCYLNLVFRYPLLSFFKTTQFIIPRIVHELKMGKKGIASK